MNSLSKKIIQTCWALAVMLPAVAAFAQDSPLIQGTTADMWLVDPETGQVTGYDTGKWLDAVNPADYPLIDLSVKDALLINRLPASSVPMTPGQPGISLVGIGDMALQAGDGGAGGHRDLTLAPAAGTYTDTIAVVIGVSSSILSGSDHRLRWTVIEQPSLRTIVDDAVIIPQGAGVDGENGFYFETFYLVNNGNYDVSVSLRGAVIDTTVAANYQLNIDPSKARRDTDGDGIPDAVEVDMGLNPFEDDWTADTDGNGWSEFDEWLRRYCLDPATQQPLDGDAECLDADGVPIDTDNDDWTDFDEVLRGTNHLDPEPVITGQADVPAAELIGTEYEAKQRLRFKDFPAANRLYEVEHLVSPGIGVLSVPPTANILLDQQSAGANLGNYPGVVVQSFTAAQDNISGIDFRVAAGGDGVEDIILNIWANSLRDGQLLLSRKIEKVLIDGDPDRPIVVRFEPVAVQPGQPIYLEFRKKSVALITTGDDTLAGGGVVEGDAADGIPADGLADLVFDVFYDANFANGIGGTRAGFQWWTVAAAGLDGALSYDAAILLHDDEITAAGLLPAEISSRRRMTTLANALGASQLPEMRLAAGNSLVVSAVHRHHIPALDGSSKAPADYSRIYKNWLPRSNDLTPTMMLAEMGEGAWTTPEQWRREFIAYLVPRLVVPVGVVLDEASTLRVSVVEAALTEEADIDGSGGLQVLNGIFQPGQPIYSFQPGQPMFGDMLSHQSPYVNDWEDNLERLAAGSFNLDQSFAEVTAALGPGQPLEPLGQWLRERFYAGVPGTASDKYMAQQVLRSFPDVCFVRAADVADLQANTAGWNEFLDQCPVWFDEAGLSQRLEADRNRCYLVRLNLLPGSTSEIAADATLLDLLIDSDSDGDLNGSEVEVPVQQLTLPWMFDSDGDGIADSVDQCPIDPYNDCSANPILPNVTIDADFAVVEPNAGSDFALISVQLDRIYDVPVTVCYEAFVDVGDTATGDVDFQLVTDCVVIEPGQLSALIQIPINADVDIDAGETFTVRITSITNGSISDDGIVVVTINDPAPDGNDAPVFTSANAINAAEGSIVTGYTATATDADGDVLTFSTSGGVDQAEFSIDAVTGVLSFVNPPDFAAPTDADGNNAYEVQLTVDDGNTGTATLDLVVTVVEAGLTIEVSYPTPNANLGGVVTTTTVTGNIVDPLGNPVDPADINFIDVNGQLAALDAGDASRWSVQVPVVNGPNTLVVTFERSDGVSTSFNVDMQNFVVHTQFIDIEYDVANARTLVLDGYLDAILDVDLVSGERTAITVNFDGNGPNFGSTTGFVLDIANNRALVSDQSQRALFGVNLTTGTRTILSSDSIGAGPVFVRPSEVLLDSANNRALLTDWGADAVFAVDLATGDRTVLSDATTGSGANFFNARELVLDSANNRAIVMDISLRAVIAVDLANGDRTVISSNSVGTGLTFTSPDAIALDLGNNRVLVADQTEGLIAIDLATGNRTLIDAPTVDYGVNGSRLLGVALDPVNDLALVVDSTVDAIFAVDLSSGNRSVVSDSATGTASELSVLWAIQGIAFDAAANRLLVPDSQKKVLWQINLATAHRSHASSDVVGAGPGFDFPGKLDVDADNGLAYYVEQNTGALMVADLATGDRTIVSGLGVGAGPAAAAIMDVALDIAGNRALFTGASANGGALFEVDLASGDRTLISDDVTGAGSVLTAPASVAIDSANNRALIMDWDSDILVAVDLASGDRTVLSNNAGMGTGTTFSVPFDMALDSDRNRVLVVDYGRDTLSAVDLASGNRTVIVGFGEIEQLNLLNPYYVVLDIEGNRAFIYDVALTGIIVVELSTGERAVVSK